MASSATTTTTALLEQRKLDWGPLIKSARGGTLASTAPLYIIPSGRKFPYRFFHTIFLYKRIFYNIYSPSFYDYIIPLRCNTFKVDSN